MTVPPRRILIAVALYAAPILAVTRQGIRDFDIWWHLRTGAWIAEHGTVPWTDPFSTYGSGRRWLAYSWLFEGIVYGVHQALGLVGLFGFRLGVSLVALATVHRLAGLRQDNFVRTCVLTALAFVACWPILNERPWLFSLLFTTLTVQAVVSLRQGSPDRAVWLLPIAYIFWSNIHIQFVYGLAVLGLACLAPWADRLRGLATPTSSWKSLVLLTLLCAAATLINPYGPLVYRVVLEFGSQAVAYALISELQPLEYRFAHDWAVLLLFSLAVFSLGRRQQISTFDVLLLAGTAYVSFRSKRDLWFVVLGALGVLASAPDTTRIVERIPLRVRLLTVCGVVLLAAGAWWLRGITEEGLRQEVRRTFPEAACTVIQDTLPPGPLFTDFDWGGYVVGRLPDHPPNIDNRMNLHGDARLALNTNTVNGLGWEEDDELWKASVVMIRADNPLASLLRKDRRFQCIHQDQEAPYALVFIPNPAQRP